MRKMGVYLGLVEDDDLVDDDPYDRIPEPAHAAPARLAGGAGSRREELTPRYARSELRGDVLTAARAEFEALGSYTEAREGREGRQSGFSAPTLHGDADGNGQSYRITTLHPRTYNEARTIGEHFRGGTPVIMNLSEMDDADAKRLVDFAAGLTFGLHGRIERVTAKVFLLSPHNVTVTAQDKARIAEGGFFNQS
jgi:cell division inhibitor SepF